MALKTTKRRERSQQDWYRTVEKFMLWLSKKHPLCTHWEMMTRQILREYLSTFDGKSANYRRLTMQPMLQTAGFMHREYEFINIGDRLGIGNKLKKTPPAVFLEDVISFCSHVKEHAPFIEAGVCLQGFAGLQMLEVLRLTWDKVDLEKGLIEISGEIKNEYRNRVIPVSDRVLESLTSSKLNHSKSEFVLCGNRGQGFDDHCSYGRYVRRAMLDWNPEIDWAPKDLRNCLPTFAIMEGIHGTIWEQYIGHAPHGVTNRHYVPRLSSATLGRSRVLDKQMELFRKFVTRPVDAEICNFLQLCSNDSDLETG